MELLKSTTSLNYFENTNIILILNQKDIFDKKLQDFKLSFSDNFPIHLASRFFHGNRSIEYKDSIYDPENDVRRKKKRGAFSQANDSSLNKAKENRPNPNEMYIAFDKKKEKDPNYCIGFIKRQFTEILPPRLQKTLRIYVTCAVGTFSSLFFFFLYLFFFWGI